MTTRRSLPSPPQARVLRAMKDGTVLVRGYVNRVSWYLQGSGAPVHANVAEAIRCAGWISSQEPRDARRHFTLTPAGTFALRELERVKGEA